MRTIKLMQLLVVLSIIVTISIFADEPLKMQTDKTYVERNQRRVEKIQIINPDILFVGDSITEKWLAEGRTIWKDVFEPLKSANYGCSGDKTQDVIWRIENAGWKGVEPRLFILMAGVNNGDKGEALFNDQKKMITTINTLYPKSKIIFIPVLPMALGTQPTKIYSCNLFAKKLEEEFKNVTVLDMTKRYLNDDGSINRSLYRDGIHLTTKGYEVWAEEMMPIVKELLK